MEQTTKTREWGREAKELPNLTIRSCPMVDLKATLRILPISSVPKWRETLRSDPLDS